MRPRTKDTSHPKIFQSPAAAAAAASVTAAYALAKSEKLDFTNMENGNLQGTEQNINAEIDAINEEKKMLELSLAEARTENSSLKEKVDEVNNSHAELTKVLLLDCHLMICCL